MSTRAVHHLQREYREIDRWLTQLDSLLAEQERHSCWRPQDGEDFQFLLDELDALLLRHFRKEEEVLFPGLQALVPQEANPAILLRDEHSDLREYLRLLHRAVQAVSDGERLQARHGVRHYGSLLVQMVRDHATLENRLLFPLLVRHCPAEEDNLLVGRMEQIDREPIPSSELQHGPPRLVTRGRRIPMAFDKQDLIERLKLEVQVIEKGGYSPSVREPRSELHIFRDSISCPNLGLQEKVEPCAHCFLMDFVPSEHSEKEDACHYIPLNEKGETVKSLEAAGDPARAQAVVLAWLKAKIAELEG